MPDTDNLLRLADYYGVTLDGLLVRGSQRDEVDDALLGSSGGRDAARLSFVGFIICLFATLTYFAWAAQPLLLSTMDDITEMFGLVPGPALAVAWFLGEVIFIVGPFLVMSIVPIRLPRWAWATPLIVFAGLSAPPFLASVIGGAQFTEYVGVGGALKASVVLKADTLAFALACVALSFRRRNFQIARQASTPSRRGKR